MLAVIVVPWGGREASLATNPMAFGVPAAGDPLVVEMTTSAVAAGEASPELKPETRAKLVSALSALEDHLEDQQALEASKSDIGWGSQIRSYVLDQSRIKDLRTNVETGNTQAVLDGGLDPFIEASLKSGL